MALSPIRRKKRQRKPLSVAIRQLINAGQSQGQAVANALKDARRIVRRGRG